MRRLIIIAVPALVAGILIVPAAADPGRPAKDHGRHESKHDGPKHQGHRQGGHQGKVHADGPGNAGSDRPTAAPKPSKPNDVVNLLLVLLIPAAMGAVGGRMLRKARVRPAH